MDDSKGGVDVGDTGSMEKTIIAGTDAINAAVEQSKAVAVGKEIAQTIQEAQGGQGGAGGNTTIEVDKGLERWMPQRPGLMSLVWLLILTIAVALLFGMVLLVSLR